MSFVRRWWPAGAAAAVMLAVTFAATLTPASPPILQPLPQPLRIALPRLPASPATSRALFPALVNAEASQSPAQTAALPTLVGIAWSRTNAVALLSDVSSQTTAAHLGDVVGRWEVKVIMPTKVIVANKGEQKELFLPNYHAILSNQDRGKMPEPIG
jgi:hypothetical protein